jgi:hypothetical protein
MEGTFSFRVAVCFVLFGLLGAGTVEIVRFAAHTHPSKPSETVEQESKRSEPVPAPNIVCLGDDYLWVELDRHEIFCESENQDQVLGAFTAKFCNQPKPAEKVGAIDNVEAYIIYTYRESSWEPHWVRHACWLGEGSSIVPFGLNRERHLIIGTFTQVQAKNGQEIHFTTYDNPSSDARLIRIGFQPCSGFRIKVGIVAGEHGEFSQEHEFDLFADGQFEYRSPKRKQADRRHLEGLVAQGEVLLARASKEDWTTALSNESTEWDTTVMQVIREKFGRVVCDQFLEDCRQQRDYTCTDKRSRERKSYLDWVYTQISNLKELIERET